MPGVVPLVGAENVVVPAASATNCGVLMITALPSDRLTSPREGDRHQRQLITAGVRRTANDEGVDAGTRQTVDSEPQHSGGA